MRQLTGEMLFSERRKTFSEEHLKLVLNEMARPQIQVLYKDHRAAGKIKNPREDVLIFHTVQKNVLHFNSTRIVKLNPVDPFDVTRAEVEARKQVLENTHTYIIPVSYL